MELNPRPIYGNWSNGWALDSHTLSSRAQDNGRARYDRFQTVRSELGEALFRLKYQGDRSQIEPLAAAVAAFVRSRLELADIRAVLAVPPSNVDRPFQPVAAIAAALAAKLDLPAPDDFIMKIKQTAPLKNMEDKRERREELDGAFGVADRRFVNLHLLLFDDLFRSGETLKAVCAALLFAGRAKAVSVVALTATRTRK